MNDPRSESSAPDAPATSAEAPLVEPEFGYQHSDAWEDPRIEHLLVSARHIQVSHLDSKSALTLAAPAQVGRSRDAARQRIVQLYAQAKRDPAQFGEMARRVSDDPLTAPLGGELGVFSAAWVPYQLLDAVLALEEGEVSRPVETELGFHILQRVKATDDLEITMSRIVIKASDSSGWRRSDRPVEDRTRAQAHELARLLAEQLQSDPTQFESLSREHSDADDALRGGDMGTRRASDMFEVDPQLFNAAAHLPVGGVSGVLDLASGAHIVMRRPLTPKVSGAVSVISKSFRGSQLSRAMNLTEVPSEADAKRAATQLAAELARHPERFDELRKQHCDGAYCEQVYSFVRGSALAAVEFELERLAQPGATSKTPLLTPVGYLLLRVEDPKSHPVPARPVRFEPGLPVLWETEQPAACDP